MFLPAEFIANEPVRRGLISMGLPSGFRLKIGKIDSKSPNTRPSIVFAGEDASIKVQQVDIIVENYDPTLFQALDLSDIILNKTKKNAHSSNKNDIECW